MPTGWENWTRHWSVDFGYTDPFVLQCWAEAPNGALYLYREIYKTGKRFEQHAEHILDIIGDEPKPDIIVCDSADPEARATLAEYLGMGNTPAKKDVLLGIQAVQRRFAQGKLYILRNCTVERDQVLKAAKKPYSTEQEIPGYIWESGKERPLKGNDHGCDAMRYMVMELETRSVGLVGFL
jgi:phage terminase large subunit